MMSGTSPHRFLVAGKHRWLPLRLTRPTSWVALGLSFRALRTLQWSAPASFLKWPPLFSFSVSFLPFFPCGFEPCLSTPTSSSPSSAEESPSASPAEPSYKSDIGYVEFIRQHGGKLVSPPYTPERCLSLHLEQGARVLFDLHGRGWVDACSDIVFPGLGWVSVTGSGIIQLRAIMPPIALEEGSAAHASAGTAVASDVSEAPALTVRQAHAREPIMPFEAKATKKRWSGSAIRQH